MGYKAMLFDLDDTLLDRDKAVEALFLIVLEKCYENVDGAAKSNMLQKFKEYDKREYGISNKTTVLESLFDEFTPRYRLPRNYIQDFGIIISLDVFNRPKYYSFLKSNKEAL